MLPNNGEVSGMQVDHDTCNLSFADASAGDSARPAGEPAVMAEFGDIFSDDPDEQVAASCYETATDNDNLQFRSDRGGDDDDGMDAVMVIDQQQMLVLLRTAQFFAQDDPDADVPLWDLPAHRAAQGAAPLPLDLDGEDGGLGDDEGDDLESLYGGLDENGRDDLDERTLGRG